MGTTPLHVAMREKSLSLGMFGTEMLPTIAAAGFNHVVFDHMFSDMTWATTKTLCAAARSHGLAPILRVQTYPWSPEPSGDMGAISEVARARTNGAAGAVVSIGSPEQLRAIMRVGTDMEHFGVWGPRAVAAYRAGGAEAVRNLLPEDLRAFPIVAYIENVALLDQLDAIVDVEGLQAIGFGIHDICYTSGHPFEVEHPDVWRVLERGIARAKARDLSVWTNTGYIFTRPDETIARIERLYSRGVDTIQVQSPAQFLQPVLSDIVTGSLRALGAPRRDDG